MLNEEKVILQRSLKLLQLQSTADETGLIELLDDELEVVDANGHRLDKSRALQSWLQTPQPQNAAEIRITLFSDTALETGLLRLQAGETDQHFCYSRLWLRNGENWRLRGFQLTRRN